ncbi:uncharacterized protein GGS22DRAFT_152182 [Annulohypoxylon maeteangense]|uniref:uncharacterized protein n=1 Tax=Annulohypoxylon maeteangense TaxID=1927788 RepID=UPI002007DF19|nr:uncharacterized protein GGS22DRAFT_152182 [Annulohypoxylon maeteangense]KAI0888694.1 hypothetical protein GGS22DRAFT_152182 [Annulohypoxylon maeteangense]
MNETIGTDRDRRGASSIALAYVWGPIIGRVICLFSLSQTWFAPVYAPLLDQNVMKTTTADVRNR